MYWVLYLLGWVIGGPGCGRVAVAAAVAAVGALTGVVGGRARDVAGGGRGVVMGRGVWVAGVGGWVGGWVAAAVVGGLGRGARVCRLWGCRWPTRRCPGRRRGTPTRRRGSRPGGCLLFWG